MPAMMIVPPAIDIRREAVKLVGAHPAFDSDGLGMREPGEAGTKLISIILEISLDILQHFNNY
jgi:hypothetical protein